MIQRLKGKDNIVKFVLLLIAALGIYLIIAWASYSPLDNAWSVASSVTDNTLNRTGFLGAWFIDVLFAMFGKVAFIIPFALFGVPSYLLLGRLFSGIDLRHIGLWTLSFLCFMVGVAGIANVLLSNSAYYLAGGFIGGILFSSIGSTLGQFGVLLVGLILTVLGFYFCSGQVLLQLFNRLYDWITENKQSQSSQSEEYTESQNTAENNHIQEELDTVGSPRVENEQFTDVSVFTRPTIKGLKTVSPEQFTTEPVVVDQSLVADEITDVSLFKPEVIQTNLPKVTVPQATAPTTENVINEEVSSFEAEEMIDTDTNAFPKVRLNSENASAIPQIVAELAEEEVVDDESEIFIERASIPKISVPSFEDETSVKPKFMQQDASPVLLDMNDSSEPVDHMPKVDILPPTQAVSSAESVAKNIENPAAASSLSYPKGYGESLVHPLLQRQKSVEKPTTPLPTLDLLSQGKVETQQITEQEIRETSARIEQELANFGVKATVEDVLVGPVVTRYEILPAAGVKATKITNLDSDLARSLIFKAIRITDVVPGKPYMGIETPNRHRETVWLRDVLNSDAFRHSKATLPMALGKDISGEPVVVDMAKMPHLLVAGQTGGGKSVGVNTMILSLLFKLTPEQVRFIMIDPKVVELSIYNDIPHLLTPVVTDMKKAENALRWAVEEMERRYLLVSSLSVRNIEGYNDKIKQAEEMGLPIPNPLWRPGDTMDALPPPLEKMSYIVLIVDEFADLMMSAGKQVEDHIMRIAQKARAVGIHLILATQRPSTDVITGVIKANIPSRIAFTVASQIDSRTILDKGGAESLLGRGDMLYSGAGSPEIIRVHGAFMSDEDVQRVADNWRARGKPNYIDSIVASQEDDNEEGGVRSSGELDPRFDEVAQFMIDGGATSISAIQRRFSLGFNRAARIIDQLEEQGILSSPDNRGKREVLAR
ncbi:DNA translocase FtsK 4TM domain-containing protein [Ursidibacter maritimus]|uniref:DNA translocase FtsK n=1 Tax=Ursidibacter maritimus TaxID=1331689 RepID=A0A949T542_9PAST|nr:DNA translocase FtsK [Ursidibacter maritimus]KAE9538988.1 cell division protein FtsK [Ursidibacter maritimus]MBV6523726.1 DNA translocase FtsK 4TM domain-containing protein [Ursidibacter maritimus]MBV6526005.1 DNA translocase FtsK 4TM domain-containing protein [Ursidibacter maritimus]MBV6527920.1 DNA translocase FtsK 4TM domain-containing protein [Ursidibacter maritimus]MBV6528859.1 DNA translocase FtsK 4TM domain-containing protein [Ursidibacter maritimus]